MIKKCLLFIMAVIGIALPLAGCANTAQDEAQIVNCQVYLTNLPETYELLSDALKDEIYISVTIYHVVNQERNTVLLSAENDFVAELALDAGTYAVSVYPSSKGVADFSAICAVESVCITPDAVTDVAVSLEDPAAFSETVTTNVASSEIIAAGLFSRTVQYNGEIIDLNNIQSMMDFSFDDVSDVKSGERVTIASSSHSGVSLILQNTNLASCTAQECSVIGVRFYSNKSVFPGGITMGTSIYDIAHAQSGILGTPDYVEGNPLIELELDQTTLVYLDPVSGDRVSFETTVGDTYVRYLSYEFAQYQ